MSTASARPDNLAAYRSRMELLDSTLRCTVGSLLPVLETYRARCPGAGADQTAPAVALNRHVARMEALDGWVGRVGEAFRAADRAAGPVQAGVVLSTDEAIQVAPPQYYADPGQPGGPKFVLGDPTKPPLRFDEDYPYDPNAEAGWGDRWSRLKWWAKLEGGDLVRSDLDDALAAYRHYWNGNGEPLTVDYEEAYREDSAIREVVDNEIISARAAAEALAAQTGLTSFRMTGDATPSGQLGSYPKTENWQKTLGAHQVWSSADVEVHDGKIRMTVVVHAEDRYNFNKGDADIATGAKDEENGRFAQLGWAKSFDTHGQLVRTVEWNIGDPAPPQVGQPDGPERNPGREDREDGRDSSDGRHPLVPDNNRSSGEPRVG